MNWLEPRTLLSGNPTYYTVNLTSGTGANSGTDDYPAAGTLSGDLQWAITQADNQGQPGYAPANPAGSVIDFDPSVFGTAQTITLSSTLELSESDGPETIQGPGCSLLTISGGNAIGVFLVDSGVTAGLSGLTISGGFATNGAGVDNSGTLTVTGCTVENNNGIGIENAGRLTVTGTTISGNAPGGGSGVENENDGSVTLTNTTIADNSGAAFGVLTAGIDNSGTLTAVNCTIAYNSVGIYDEQGATTTLYDTVVALNTGYDSSELLTVSNEDIAGGPVSSDSAYNMIGIGGSPGLVEGSNGNMVGVMNPGLARLAESGGPTQTIALLEGSPAIGAGSSTIPGITVPTTDQRGCSRPGYGNGIVDIGAFESPSFGDPTVYTVDLTSDTGAFDGASAATASSGDLLWAITQANANTNPAGSVIEFAPSVFNSSSPQTITLTATLELCESPWPEVIQGPGANAVTICGHNAVQVFQVDGSTTAAISGVTVSGGSSSVDVGGGIGNDGTLTVTDSVIENNIGGSGGGIGNNGGTLTVSGSTIECNSSGSGGGIANFGVATVNNCDIANNSSTSGAGGIQAFFLTVVSDSTIACNSAQADGGGVANSGTLDVFGSTIDENSCAGYVGGGGVEQSTGSMMIADTTIAANSAQTGGGIFLQAGALTIISSTVAGNRATDADTNAQFYGGGGLYLWRCCHPGGGPAPVLDDSIVSNSSDPGGSDDIAGAALSPASSYNLVGVDKTGSLSAFNHNLLNVTDPGLGPLQNNGGPTQTMALLPGSPAIDAGSASIPAVTVPGTDQRGALRGPVGLNAGSAIDIGAYEASSSYLVTSSAVSTDVGTLQTAIGWASVNTNANPANAASPAPNTLVFDPTNTQSLDQDLAAVGSLTLSNSTPLPITIKLSANTTYENLDGSGNTLPIDVAAPTGVTLTLDGPPSGAATIYDLVTSGTVTIEGNINVIGDSPALVVNSGQTTIADGVTLVTSTNAPTIQVNGGTLVVRDSTIEQSSTTSIQPAILTDGGSVNLGTAASPGGNMLDVNGTGPLIDDPTGSPVSATGDSFESDGTIVPSSFGNVALSTAASQTANQGVTQPFSLGSLTDTVKDSQSWTVDVNWGDGSSHTDFNATSTGLLATQSHAFALPGTYTVTVTATDPVANGASAWDLVQTFSVTVAPSVFVIDATAGGALSLSGNATLKIPGAIVVDSSSSSALSASGNAASKAAVIDVHGKVSKSGNASFSPAPTTGAAVLSDPLASLAEPSTSGLTSYGSESVSGNSSASIKPGIYSGITVSGNATLTMNSGVYIIEGGGFSVSGNASVSGTGVTIFNAGSKYPTTGGTYGSITLSGNGSYNLTPPTSGTYTGIVIFQTRDNSKAITISGNASGMTGTIYAPAAQLSESGSGALNAALIVDTLSISGNGVANTVTLSSPSGTVAYSPAQVRDAYGLSALSEDGTGQTIAIVDAYDDPNIYQSVDAFDAQFGLTTSGPTLYGQYGPASSFLTVLNQFGQATSLPGTDPSGAGTDNWEVEEALDVEWTHAIAPGAQIILVEANSQSLSDLMAGVATAAAQPGVSVVTMSWGFAEGQAVFASDEATYDSYFDVPGVTFVASTGDYGAADPEYPAFSPNVVAVGGTSLTLNGDNSYNSETGWGYFSSAAGTLIGSGGGISLYELEPAYQQGVQSTGYRTTPDVSMVADPATGAWIADSYNLNPTNPFEVVGGTSLSAPAWAGIFALVNEGRAAAGESTLNSSTPTDAQQALYVLPQSAYNVISSGNNGYTATAGYNLVTGLGTPVANLLVPDLVAYHGAGTTYEGSTVAPLENSGLVDSGSIDGGPMDVFSVFDALTVNGSDLGTEGDRMRAAGLADQANPPVRAGGQNVRLESLTYAQDVRLESLTYGGGLTVRLERLSYGVVPSGADTGASDPGMPRDSSAVRDAHLTGWSPAAQSSIGRSAAQRRRSGSTASPSPTPIFSVQPAPVLSAGTVDALFADADMSDRLLSVAGNGPSIKRKLSRLFV